MQTQMLIGDALVSGTETEEQILNPRTGEVIVTLPEASLAQVETAVSAAATAFTVVPIVIMGVYLWGARKMGAFDAL